MPRLSALLLIALTSVFAMTQSDRSGELKIALPEHRGQLSWTAPGFEIVESSAKPTGSEVGLRGVQQSTGITFLGFLFLVPEDTSLTNAKCRDGAMVQEKKSNSTVKELSDQPIALVSYIERGKNGDAVNIVRGFLASQGICGDLEVYGDSQVRIENPDIKRIFDSYRFDKNYVPSSRDAIFYAQILYEHQAYEAAAPIFEGAIKKLANASDQNAQTWRRVATDQAGISYGISGHIDKARAIFNAAIAKDPDYPLYYYNLACADAEQKDLSAARRHLQEAFARKANVLPGEQMPDPTKDDSFLPYRDNKEFWNFLTGVAK